MDAVTEGHFDRDAKLIRLFLEETRLNQRRNY
jgi:hypothetical protein